MFQCQWLWWRWWQLFVLPLVSLSTAKIGDRIVYRMASHFHTRGSQGAPWRPLTLALFTNHTTYREPQLFQKWNTKKKGAIWAMLTPALLGAYNNLQQGVQRCATRPKNMFLRWKVLKSFTPSNKSPQSTRHLSLPRAGCNWVSINLLPQLSN